MEQRKIDVLVNLREELKRQLFQVETDLNELLPTWQEKAACGLKTSAIFAFYNESGCTIGEAKRYIENYLVGQAAENKHLRSPGLGEDKKKEIDEESPVVS